MPKTCKNTRNKKIGSRRKRVKSRRPKYNRRRYSKKKQNGG